MKQHKLGIIQVNISDLNPAAYNPRKWPPSSIRHLTESIKRFGLVDPIIANSAPNRKNIVIGGHFRLKIAKELGYKKVPVVYLDIPDQTKEKELNLRLNRNTGEWDLDLLKEMDLSLLLDVGFTDDDLSQIWDEALEIEDDNFNEETEVFEDMPIHAGDIFKLGDHKLICGDSTDHNILKKLLGDEGIDMLYCDPPYNISLDYNKGVGTKGKYGGTKVQDSKSNSEYSDFIEQTLQSGLLHTKEDAHVFYWCDERYIGLFQDLYRQNNVTNQRVCLWIKNSQNATPQIAFNKAYEPCVYGTIGKPFLSSDSKYSEILNKEVDNGNRCIDDITDIFSIWLAKRLPTSGYNHPTEKPPTLHERPLRRCTKPNDAVLDLFGGSGSTLIACEQLKRRCFLVEIDPHFCNLIIQRYENLTGTKAEKLN